MTFQIALFLALALGFASIQARARVLRQSSHVQLRNNLGPQGPHPISARMHSRSVLQCQ